MNNVPQNCQEIQTKLAGPLRGFVAELQSTLAQNQVPSLRLSLEELALLLAAWPDTPAPLFAWTLYPPEKNRLLQQQITAWQTVLGVSTTWHILQGELSEQEKEGSVNTALSTGLHHALAASRRHRYIVAHEDAAPLFPSPQAYHAADIALHIGERMPISRAAALLAANGFLRHTTAREPGSFTVHGEQLEVWHPAYNPLRITWYGTSIEQIVESVGKRTRLRNKVVLPPLRFPEVPASLAEILAQATVFRPALAAKAIGAATITYDASTSALPFPFTSIAAEESIDSSQEIMLFAHNLDRMAQYARTRYPVHNVTVCAAPASTIPLRWQTAGYALISEAAVFPAQEDTETLSYRDGLALIAELKEGRPAVHSDHGIGIFEGLHARDIGGVRREYIVIRYAEGDVLSVPVELAYKVTAYVGDTAPTIHKLGGKIWSKTTDRAQRDAVAFAKELLAIAQNRQQSTRPSFSIDSTLEEQLRRSFPYPLTEGQAATWEEVKRDLAKPVPADRLIVGDVGFGKTEIAVRAAVHAAANGRQVALLAPTTLLVQQHFDTLAQRLKALPAGAWQQSPATVAMLSRFATAAQQARVRRAMIVVGTHALLAAATRWKNLGLVIIDEEQRFGVGHKEHFKKVRAAVDVLSLSATPIPRTLSMALTGLKSLSVISSPPPRRRDVKTFVGKENEHILQKAIQQEITRGGQVYVVLPRIRGLHTAARIITKLVPHASVATAHGRLPSGELARIMHEFNQGTLQVLVSSTIVENGLDLPNANTLIVLQTTHFGLSELYQLRGRVGRRARQGYAYFLYRQEELNGVQRQRLAVLTETSRVGSGWALAQRDLELRGAGNLLGAEQSGTVNAVGVQLYLDLVREAVAGNAHAARPDVEIQTPFPIHVPSHYIADLSTRLRHYQQLSRARSEQEIDTQVAAITATYGEPPAAFNNLVLVLKLQLAAARQGVRNITYQTITPPDEPPYARISITGADPLRVLAQVAARGNWAVRGHAVQRDVDAVTPALFAELYSAFQDSSGKIVVG